MQTSPSARLTHPTPLSRVTRLAGPVPAAARRWLCAAALCLPLAPALAALQVGAAAPDFNTEAALAGKTFKFTLAESLKKGPVVLYFYPKAFTSGCTLEAHQFAEATEQFEKLGATVIGISNDSIETLQKFSVEACRNKFAVAADAGAKVMKDYDARLMLMPGTADRISYLITRDGRIAAVHASLNAEGHVTAMLKATQALAADKAKTASSSKP